MRFIMSIFTAALLLTLSPALAADRYDFDKSHTNILFFIKHLGYSNMVGVMNDFDGHFTFDEKKPEESTLEVSVKPASVRTSSEALDKKLQNSDFFNTEKFPEIRFVSKSIKITGEKTGDIIGDLTMLGVTKPVTLHVTFNKGEMNSFSNKYTVGFSAEATLKRSEFGMNSYISALGDEVRILIETEATKFDPNPPPHATKN